MSAMPANAAPSHPREQLPTLLRLDAIRPAHADEMPFVLRSWVEAHKRSPRGRRLNWAEYKTVARPEIVDCLARRDTRILVADVAGDVAGWIAYAPGRSLDAIHWITTRNRLRGPDGLPVGETIRRRGVMSALVAAAALKPRAVYTFRGPKIGPETIDLPIARWLASHGVIATHEPYARWRS
jgi:hypothetical protein